MFRWTTVVVIRMNKIHSGVLAIVLSIFLIQATDPPIENSTGTLLQFSTTPKSIENTEKSNDLIARNTPIAAEQNREKLALLQHYLDNIKSERKSKPIEKLPSDLSPYDVINRFIQRDGKTHYERLLEKDFIRPLLKLYESQSERDDSQANTTGRISKEDSVEEIESLSKEELDLLMNEDKYYQVSEQTLTRRDDDLSNVDNNNDQEHIGEILPPDFQKELQKQQQRATSASSKDRYTKNLFFLKKPEAISAVRRRNFHDYNFRPIIFPHETIESPRFRMPLALYPDRFRPEYEPTVFSTEGRDLLADPSAREEVRFARPGSRGPPVVDQNVYRYPRRLRGFREAYADAGVNGRDGPQWGSSRRPRVIFPTDLVAFREPQHEEPEWLASDSNLQDIQEQDDRDRGNIFVFGVVI